LGVNEKHEDLPADSTTSIPIVEGFTGPIGNLDFSLMDIPAGSAALVVVKGPQIGDYFVLKTSINILGRGEEADLMLDDVTVSRKHATIEKTNSGWVLMDMGSLNGTYVNREIADNIVLRGGDELQIGKYRFAFLLPDQGN
jgi:pSer/pThr/pTyr-binding forkhead associated (FHA) protein